MQYTQYQPAPPLRPYIDVYWILQTDALFKPLERKIYADGCTEIIVNVGNSAPVIGAANKLVPGNIYLGGTMTAPSWITSLPDTSFVGVRFKPGGLPAFYTLPFEEIVDGIIEFPDRLLWNIARIDQLLVARLDAFFMNKINPKPTSIIALTSVIEVYKGMISVDFLAQKHHLTIRTLERVFKRQMGISPKSFINIVKFKHTSERIRNNTPKDSLLAIAYDMGYYDHSHLTREIKKYSGLNPSEMPKPSLRHQA